MPLTGPRARVARWGLIAGLVLLIAGTTWRALPWLCRGERPFRQVFSLEGRIAGWRGSESQDSWPVIYGFMLYNRCTGELTSSRAWYPNGYIAEQNTSIDGRHLVAFADEEGRFVAGFVWFEGEIDPSDPLWPPEQTSPSAPWLELGLSPEEWWSRVADD